jgi:Domain of unknown function (DUF5664)
MSSETSSETNEGLHYDNNKPKMDLIDPSFLEGLADVLTYGLNKYAKDNWRHGIHISRLIASAYRHLGEINKGEDLDSESGKPHIFHLACNIMFISWLLKNKKEFDDRYKESQSPGVHASVPKSHGVLHPTGAAQEIPRNNKWDYYNPPYLQPSTETLFYKLFGTPR